MDPSSFNPLSWDTMAAFDSGFCGKALTMAANINEERTRITYVNIKTYKYYI